MSVIKIDVDIICPGCSRKALLAAEIDFKGYMFNPKKITGKASCVHCGYSHPKLTVMNADLFYQFPVADRMFYARNKENLQALLRYFKERKKWDEEPDLDFPKVFYVHRDEIVKKIEGLL